MTLHRPVVQGLALLVAVPAWLVVLLGLAFAGSGEGSSSILAALALPWALGATVLIWCCRGAAPSGAPERRSRPDRLRQRRTEF